jgi:hypothetical protein
MKGSFLRIIILLTVTVVLVSISGGLYARAQDQNGAADEAARQVSALPAKGSGVDIQTASSTDGGAADEVARPASDPSDKTLPVNSSANNAPAAGMPAPGADANVPNSPTASWKWFTVAGAAFIPSSNAMTWAYGGAGCLAPSSAGVWRASINIPDGSILEEIYFGYWNSASSASSTAYLYRYYYTGTYQEVTHVNSKAGSAETGYNYIGATFNIQTVDNLLNSYAFVWGGSTTQQLCYIQVGYIPSNAFGLALPSISKLP